MPCPARNPVIQYLRPSIAAYTYQSLVPKTVYMLVIVITYRHKFLVHQLRECFHLYPPTILSPPISISFSFSFNQFPQFQAPRYPIQPHPTNHIQLVGFSAQNPNKREFVNCWQFIKTFPPIPRFEIEADDREGIRNGEIQFPVSMDSPLMEAIVQDRFETFETFPRFGSRIVEEDGG